MELLRQHKTLIMGIMNVTPDSFSDGGEFLPSDNAIQHALRLVEEGADILDFGAESTRPGSDRVPTEVQLERLEPVIQQVRDLTSVPISIDTTDSKVAERLLSLGADLINDISGLQFDDAMANLLATNQVPVVIMHIQGTPGDMQKKPEYKDVISDIYTYFLERVEFAVSRGISEKNIILDPGIGFGKTVVHNYRLIKEIHKFTELGFPIMVGASRKSFIGNTLDLPVTDRLEGSLAVEALAIKGGAKIIRVHDVKESVRVARMVDAILNVKSRS